MTTATFSSIPASGSLWREQFLLEERTPAALSGWLRVAAALQVVLLGGGLTSALVLN